MRVCFEVSASACVRRPASHASGGGVLLTHALLVMDVTNTDSDSDTANAGGGKDSLSDHARKKHVLYRQMTYI